MGVESCDADSQRLGEAERGGHPIIRNAQGVTFQLRILFQHFVTAFVVAADGAENRLTVTGFLQTDRKIFDHTKNTGTER